MNFAKKVLQEKKKNEEKLISHLKKETLKRKNLEQRIKEIEKNKKVHQKVDFELNIYCVDDENN